MDSKTLKFSTQNRKTSAAPAKIPSVTVHSVQAGPYVFGTLMELEDHVERSDEMGVLVGPRVCIVRIIRRRRPLTGRLKGRLVSGPVDGYIRGIRVG